MFADILVFGSVAAFVTVAVVGHVFLLQVFAGRDWFRHS